MLPPAPWPPWAALGMQLLSDASPRAEDGQIRRRAAAGDAEPVRKRRKMRSSEDIGICTQVASPRVIRSGTSPSGADSQRTRAAAGGSPPLTGAQPARPGGSFPTAQPDASLQRLLATSPRPGGLLDAMRARGTLQVGAQASPAVPKKTCATRVQAAESRTPSSEERCRHSAHEGLESADAAAALPQRPPPLPAKVVAAVPEPWQRLRQAPLPPRRPEDNYEISEKGDSADEGTDERDDGDKHIPAWSADYGQAIAAQEGVDPDSIFGVGVPHCDLDAIFPDILYRAGGRAPPRRKRGSSCQWAKDRLRRSEIGAYRLKMGQQKRWSALNKSLWHKVSLEAARRGPRRQPGGVDANSGC